MSAYSCRLPANLAEDIAGFESDVKRFLSGELPAPVFKAKRVPRGIYEQRRNGSYMLRVRLPGGLLSAAQARVLADLGREYGSGTLHVTTRQDIQFHDVEIADTPTIMRRMLAAGLTCKGGGGNTVRNVAACPYAGVCPSEAFDVTPYALAVTEYLIGVAGSYNLPRKYKVAFSGCAADCALASVTDVGFIAHGRDGRPGFAVYAGGGMGSGPRIGDRIIPWLAASECIRAAEAGRRLFDRLGDRHNRRRARLRFAVEKAGAAEFADMFQRELATVAADGVPECGTPPEAAGSGDCSTAVEASFVWRDGLRVLAQRQDGMVTVPVDLPLGEIAWADLKALAGMAERFSGEQELRATADQKLLLRSVRESDLAALRAALDGLADKPAPEHALTAFVACTGADTCRLGLCLSQPVAHACAQALEQAGITAKELQGIDFRINGCMNSCAQHPIGTVGLFGVALRAEERLIPAYRVVLGGRRGEGRARFGETVGNVPVRAIPEFIAELVRDFREKREAGETLSDYYQRRGNAYFKEMTGRYAHIPPLSEHPEFARDWGSEVDFSLAERGPSECGAGVFAVITDDIAAARRALAGAGEAPDKPEALFKAALAATRALLLARGVESTRPEDILGAFELHFVDAGLVPDEFRGLLGAMRGYLTGQREALLGREELLGRLVDRVDALFNTLDADSKFHPIWTKAGEGAPAHAVPPVERPGASTVEMDLRGVACPLNFVKAKLRLEELAVGDVLHIVLDDGEPARSVPASFASEGQQVLETERQADGHWRVSVRKAR